MIKDEDYRQLIARVRSIEPTSLMWVVSLLDRTVEDMKEELTNVKSDEFLSLQGAIKRVRMLSNDLKRPKTDQREKVAVGGTYM